MAFTDDNGTFAHAAAPAAAHPHDDADADAAALLELGEAMVPSRALQVVATIGLADLFEDAPRSAHDLAAETSTDPHVLTSILRLLGGHGVFAETADGRFGLTARGALLRSDHPRSMRPVLSVCDFTFPVLAHLDHSLRAGEPAFLTAYGLPLFEYYRAHPDRGAIFDAAMSEISRAESAAILRSYDFSAYRRIVDVGGGEGVLLTAALSASPTSAGVLFDQPHVTARAEQAVAEAGLDGRLTIVSGDFFESVPPDGDLYVLKSVIHDWGDDQAVEILRNCRRAISPTGRLVLFEHMLIPDNAPSQTKTWDLVMFTINGGRERTRTDYEKLFGDSGFRLDRVVPTGSAVFGVEGLPVP